MPWHTRCEQDCSWRCTRPGCLEPGLHFFAKATRKGNRWVGLHDHDCTVPALLAMETADALRAVVAPDDLAIARRVLAEALNQLERADKRPSIVRESA